MRTRLRQASHSIHARMQQHPLLVGLMGPECSVATYHAVLTVYAQLYEQLEAGIIDFLNSHTVPFDYSTRQKLPQLRDDLIFLNQYSPIQSNRTVHPIKPLKIKSVGELIGVLYPIEGSTLGGQLISRHLKGGLDFSPDRGARFFNGYGDKTTARWEEFCHFANSIQDNMEQCRAAESATLLTFSLFEDALNDYH